MKELDIQSKIVEERQQEIELAQGDINRKFEKHLQYPLSALSSNAQILQHIDEVLKDEDLSVYFSVDSHDSFQFQQYQNTERSKHLIEFITDQNTPIDKRMAIMRSKAVLLLKIEFQLLKKHSQLKIASDEIIETKEGLL